MHCFKINKIPMIRENNIYDYRFMQNVLFALTSNYSCASIEMLFYHKTGKDINICFFLHNASRDIVATVESKLKTENYQIETLNEEQSIEIYNDFYKSLIKDASVILKTEKIVTTPCMQEGYYYWADSLFSDNETKADNYSSLFQLLQNTDDSYISFQLIPTRFENYEIDTLQYLSSFLKTSTANHMVSRYGAQPYEPYAQSAYETYQNYVDNRNRPLFLYNIMVGSGSNQANVLSNQLIATLRSQTSNKADLQSVQLNSFDIPEGYEGFPNKVNEIVMQKYRDLYIWGGSILQPRPLYRLPFFATVDEALTYFHLPIDDGKIVGVSSTSYQTSNEFFDKSVTDLENIIFGQLISDENTFIGASPKDFTKHALIVGMPGFGKTNFCIDLLMQFSKKGIPFLAFEPTKAEYRAMIDVVPDLQVFTPGNSEVSPFVINPFLPPEGITLEKFIPSLFGAFKAAFSMPSPLDVIFYKTIQEAYAEYGWRSYSKLGDPEVTVFGMQEFIRVFKNVIKQADYRGETRANIETGGVLRLANLIEQNKGVFDTIHSIPVADILSSPTVIELNAIDNQEQKALIMSLILVNVCLHIKNNQLNDGKIKNVILIDEAHVLLNPKSNSNDGSADTQNSTVEYIENMIAEVRSFGTSVIICDQRPSKAGRAIVANTDIKVSFRLTENDEKSIFAKSTGMSDDMQRQLSLALVGEAYAYYHRMLNPQLIKTPDIRKKANIRLNISDFELKERNTYWKSHKHLLKPYSECISCKKDICDFRVRSDADFYVNKLWNAKRDKIKDIQSLLIVTDGVPIILNSYLKDYPSEKKDELIICIRLQLLKKAALEKGIIVSDKHKKLMLSSAEVRKE